MPVYIRYECDSCGTPAPPQELRCWVPQHNIPASWTVVQTVDVQPAQPVVQGEQREEAEKALARIPEEIRNVQARMMGLEAMRPPQPIEKVFYLCPLCRADRLVWADKAEREAKERAARQGQNPHGC